ncbi:unnamed protein product [Vitrella brassicaformis CCMP3155]|uniref:Uncharacterized protein n=1 Tax=Vitrella brassicaformis (strain CCMP3155) TaxID=1169540 RepID=A0A0G4G0A8_VITBC|nr:unnamed protein product [Vitrella brassicaformis CCMP3155]|eukprot:CEM21291.1 unnamed protein product [Vitrella brassicaformis CCMP3155]
MYKAPKLVPCVVDRVCPVPDRSPTSLPLPLLPTRLTTTWPICSARLDDDRETRSEPDNEVPSNARGAQEQQGAEMGFAKIAIEQGVTIVPTCSVGTEDMLEILKDVLIDWLIGKSSLTAPIIKYPTRKPSESTSDSAIPSSRLRRRSSSMQSQGPTHLTPVGVKELQQRQADDAGRMLPDRVKCTAEATKAAITDQADEQETQPESVQDMGDDGKDGCTGEEEGSRVRRRCEQAVFGHYQCFWSFEVMCFVGF